MNSWLALAVNKIRNYVPGWSGPVKDPYLGTWIGRPNTRAGVEIDQNTALNYSAVVAATRLISETIAAFPKKVFIREKPDSDSKREYWESPLHSMFSCEPNPEQGEVAYYCQQIPFLLNWGNMYAEIERNSSGEVVAEWPIHPKRIPASNIARGSDLRRALREGLFQLDGEFDIQDAGELIYLVDNDDGTKTPLRRREILHIPGALSENGVTGRGLIDMGRESIAMGIATERFGATFFGNGVNPSVMLRHPRSLSKEAAERLKRSWQKRKGVDNANHLIVLEEGLEVERLTIPPDQAQFLSTRQFNITEIARWYNLPPHMLRELSKSSFNNIEQENIHYVMISILPWVRKIENERDRQLVSRRQRGRVFHKFMMDGLLRGDAQARADFNSKMFNCGGMTINDMLRDMDRNPIGPEGDMRFVPVNLMPLENAKNVGDRPDDPGREDNAAGDSTGTAEESQADNPANSGGDGGNPSNLPDNRTDSQPGRESVRGQDLMVAREIAIAYTRDILGRMVTKEVKAALTTAKREQNRAEAGKESTFFAWLDDWCEKHRGVMICALREPSRLWPSVGSECDLEALVDSWVAESREAFLEASGVPASQLQESMEKTTENWETDRLEKTVETIFATVA